MSSSSSTFISIFIITMVLVAFCSANLATGRASLRPSAGKRAAVVGRLPAHYYQLASAVRSPKQYENEFTCNENTMSVINARYQKLQEELNGLVELMEACQTLQSTISL
ncbi:Neuropeptide-Like Protein [Caenorhabditis elegans]|uniref:Neuropeptide-Like Protein n=1 Tax=Caenorhabditis elegans TaxID=6239 RepID=Q19195_CAEEL|nr:Neuropeptide-Like Protein [Caenorhabditis elegans]CCD67650.1 Neuropeptide-Like Protein [Caenorhabditis elegans]|eukprot:NP_501488.1 Neuropeptide-Like Protein [Caenorhabditis elegans]